MRFTIDSRAISAVANTAYGYSLSRSISMTSRMLLTATKPEEGEGMVEIKTTSGTASFRSTVEASVDEQGMAAVSAERICDVLASLPEGDYEFSLVGAKLTVKAKDAGLKIKVVLPCVPADQFPSLPECPEDKFSELSCSSLSQAITHVAFCANKMNETIGSYRYVLRGIRIEKEGSDLVFAATDGRILGTEHLECSGFDDLEGAIVPTDFLLKAKALMKNGSCYLAIHEQWIFIKIGRATISSLLMNGMYPAWKKIIPSNPCHAKVEGKDLLSSIVLATSTTGEKVKKSKLSIKDSSVSFQCMDNVHGEGEMEIPAEKDGANAEMFFNGDMLASCISTLKDGKIDIAYRGTPGPIVIAPAVGPRMMYVIAPMEANA